MAVLSDRISYLRKRISCRLYRNGTCLSLFRGCRADPQNSRDRSSYRNLYTHDPGRRAVPLHAFSAAVADLTVPEGRTLYHPVRQLHGCRICHSDDPVPTALRIRQRYNAHYLAVSVRFSG